MLACFTTTPHLKIIKYLIENPICRVTNLHNQDKVKSNKFIKNKSYIHILIIIMFVYFILERSKYSYVGMQRK